jgi:hypothetical protein
MNPVQSKPREAFYPLQVAGTIRGSSVAVIKPSPNVVSQIITSGSPKPHATVSNSMVARVDSYTSPPGLNMAHYLAIDVDKAGGDDTTVADALQRYLNVAPNRKPGGDPKDLASHDSFPTLVIGETKAWEDIMPYQFSVNGVAMNQNQPTFFARAGSLKVRLVGRGVSTVTTPATESGPSLQAGPIPPGAYYPPEVAAQMSMRRLNDMLSTPEGQGAIEVGPDLSQDPASALSRAREKLQGMSVDPAGPPISERVEEGLQKFANMGIYKSSPQLFLTAMAASA